MKPSLPKSGPVSAAEIRATLARLERLPRPLAPPANKFSLARFHAGVVYVSSMTPIDANGQEMVGEIEPSRLENGCLAAEWSAANSLLGLCSELDARGVACLGALDMLVFCNAPAGFGLQSLVADAASGLVEKVMPGFPQAARGAIGAQSLVRDVSVVVKASYLVTS